MADLVARRNAPRVATVVVFSLGCLALYLLLLGYPNSNLVGLLLVAWCGVFPFRGVLAPFLVALYFPSTVDFGLPLLTPSLLYFMAVGAAILYAFRYGLAGGLLGAKYWAPLVAGIVAVSIGSTASAGEIQVELRPYIALLALAWVFSRAAHDAPDLFRRCLTVGVWVGAAVGVLAIYQTVTDSWPILDDYAVGVQYTSAQYFGRPGGTMGHPILLAAVLSGMTVVAAVLRPRLWQVAAVLCLAGVALSGSRSAYAALGAAVIVMILARRQNRSLTVTRTAGIAALGLGVLTLAAQVNASVAAQIQSVVERLSLAGDESLSARGTRGSVAWDRITDNWQWFLLGQGPGADDAFILRSGFGDLQALTFDNYYLVLWFNHGLVAVLLLAGGLVAIWRSGGALARPLVALIAVEMAFFDASGWMPMLGLMALAGAAVSYDRAAASDSVPADDDPRGAGRLNGDRLARRQ